jgi:hypothetical protein
MPDCPEFTSADFPHTRDEYARQLESSIAEYATDVRWIAPRRGLALTGREAVAAHLLRESASMQVTLRTVTAPPGTRRTHLLAPVRAIVQRGRNGRMPGGHA